MIDLSADELATRFMRSEEFSTLADLRVDDPLSKRLGFCFGRWVTEEFGPIDEDLFEECYDLVRLHLKG